MIYRIVAYKAKPETNTVWLPVETVTFESDAIPDEIAAAIKHIANNPALPADTIK